MSNPDVARHLRVAGAALNSAAWLPNVECVTELLRAALQSVERAGFSLKLDRKSLDPAKIVKSSLLKAADAMARAGGAGDIDKCVDYLDTAIEWLRSAGLRVWPLDVHLA